MFDLRKYYILRKLFYRYNIVNKSNIELKYNNYTKFSIKTIFLAYTQF